MLPPTPAPLHLDRNRANLPPSTMSRPAGKGVPIVLLPAPRHGNAAFHGPRSPAVTSARLATPSVRGEPLAAPAPGLASLPLGIQAVPSELAETSKGGAARLAGHKAALLRTPPPSPPSLPDLVPDYLLSTTPVAAFRKRNDTLEAVPMRRSRSRSQQNKTPRLADLQDEIMPHRHEDEYFKPTGSECMTGRLDESSSIFNLPHFLGWKPSPPDRLRLVQLGGDIQEGKRSERVRTPFELVQKIPRVHPAIGVDAICFKRVRPLKAKASRKRRVEFLLEGEMEGGSKTPKLESGGTSTPTVRFADVPSIEITPAPSSSTALDPPPEPEFLPQNPKVRRRIVDRAAKAYAFERTRRTIGIENWEARLDFEEISRDFGEKLA